MKLTLGPLVDAWSAAALRAFYDEVADSVADRVVLDAPAGRRAREPSLADWLAIAERLACAGKDVVVGARLLLACEGGVGALRRIAREGRHRIEANDMGAVQMLADHARFVAGPGLNVYHAEKLGFLVSSGATHWVPPHDAAGASVQAIVAACAPRPEVEVAASGRLPLDFSPCCAPALRCFALAQRASHGRGRRQTTLHPYWLCCLVEALPTLRGMDVASVRLDARRDAPGVLQAVRAALDGRPARHALTRIMSKTGACDLA